jgi:hypothetical protein
MFGMGLNSLQEIIINMRYYTETQIPSNILYLYKNYLLNTKEEQWILTGEGLYKYINDQLHKFKLRISEHNTNNSESNIKSSNLKWKKINSVYKIPIKHAIIKIKIQQYKLHPKSNTSFIIELIDDKIHDYYFESDEDIENHSLKEDINSFLSLLN